MKHVITALNGARALASKILAYIVIAYSVVVAVPALLVFGLAVIISPKVTESGKPKMSAKEVTERIQRMTQALKDAGLEDKLEVTVNGKLTTKR